MIRITVALICLVAFTIAATFLYIYKEYILCGVCASLAFIDSLMIVRILVSVDIDMSILIEAVKNQDTSLRFPKRKYYARVGEKLNQISAMLHYVRVKTAEKQHYFNIILDNIQVGVMVVDSRMRVITTNKTCLSMLYMDIVPCIDRIRKIYPELASSLCGLRHKDCTSVQLPDRNLSIACSEASFFHYGKIKLFVLTEISQALNRKEEETWSLSVRTLSHEIMNSLAPIISISQTLREVPDEEIDMNIIRESLDTISSMSENLKLFAQNYRALALMPNPQISSHSLLSMIKEVIGVATHWQSGIKPIAFEVNVPESIIVYCDRTLTIRAISNVVKNAVEAVTLNDNPIITIFGSQESNRSTLSISNNGPIIPANIIKDIFTPFFTTRSGGQGIGLSLSKRIMSAQRGALVLEQYDKKRNYTTFSFQFMTEGAAFQ